MQLKAVDRVEKQDCGLSLKVTVFPPGPFQPHRDQWEPLHASFDNKSDLPVYWKRHHILNCVQDEAAFRAEHGRTWFERCWFLSGRLRREPSGHLYAVVARSLPAAHVISSSTSFRFTPETWLEHRKKTEGAGELLLGWLHTHSIDSIRSACKKLEKGSQPGSEAKESPCKSGLFLSQEDITSALRYGFSGAFQLTCVLDSDACVVQQADITLSRVLGVWGWSAGLLRQRSVNVINGPWGMGDIF